MKRIVFVDFGALARERERVLGRPMSRPEADVQGMVDAIRIDAMATGRSVAETVKNCGKSGPIDDAVKAALGLIPPVN